MSLTPSAELGVLTLGFGADRYRRLAVNLARSLQRHSPGLPRAVVTDRPEQMSRWYDVVVPHDAAHGSGFAQKLALDVYTPFSRTLFLDSDCLAVRDVREVVDLLAGHPFAACGRAARTGEWFGADIATVLERLGGTRPLALFNGGLYYWERSTTSQAVFSTARATAARYEELGFFPMRGRPGALTDEPLVSIGMRTHGVDVVDDGGSTMRTPLGMEGELDVDVLAGRCSFVKEGRLVEPAVLHFCGGWAESTLYRREVAKLRAARWLPLPPALVSSTLDAALVAGRGLLRSARLVRAGLRRGPGRPRPSA
ncbi:hypothetical protein [Pseudokineococcus sp. 1T1Z-3]|uniref:hypothetical protein n=1 Tax=Pseudokineococcus sp. 1T1Z-3 TaxID=3132745 RepID=UPI00309B6359